MDMETSRPVKSVLIAGKFDSCTAHLELWSRERYWGGSRNPSYKVDGKTADLDSAHVGSNPADSIRI